MAAAVEVIASEGAGRASFKVIAERAGLSSTGLISYHFAGRDELIDEVGRTILEHFTEFVLAETKGVEEPVEVLRAFARANLRFLAENRAEAITLVRIRGDLTLNDLTRSDQAQLADVLRQGQRSGAFRKFDPHIVAVFILAIRDGIIRQLDVDPELDLAAAGREYEDAILHATRKD